AFRRGPCRAHPQRRIFPRHGQAIGAKRRAGCALARKGAGEANAISPQLAGRLALRPLATDSVLLIDWRRSSIGRRPMLLRIGLSFLLLALVASGSVVAPSNLRSETAKPPDAPAPGEPSQPSADKVKGHLAPAS